MDNKDMEEKQKTSEKKIENTEGDKIDPAQKLADKEKELEKCQEKVLRLAADLENFKKRIEREKSDYMKYALESFAKELLPFLDNLERAVTSAKDSRDFDKLIEGLDLTMSGHLKTLERFGLKAFTAEGQKFDPNLHEALTVQEQDGVKENIVIKELLKGYSLHERILRPALVVVSKKCNRGE
ncbi:MAG: nucleotide exchange factor GrpE [Deltaproteobacteria bacterium]|nr:nucleotide exchange factor GrpE [Deltaproteobacteria bacterium]MBW1719587.1 nucleotide exchange factor GrpE [Deltaproteobacteria bacterium]MBW1932093.1 nucleotide exchange factor GrpE [Deltaproteobacteria bacterium]MBW1938269.1 nucleotide exchange factor GrpE [Deltaproteobacteria bacterium]MBW1964719.1 nucleotide exchange factor GrpE [Deltaproteobacteria bacterium]